MPVTGREREIEDLNSLYDSDQAQLVAIYGRRRVGKTFLVESVFKDRITFQHAGLSPVENGQAHLLKDQLNFFYLSLQYQGLKGGKKPRSWMEAFFLLQRFLDEQDDGNRQLVFLDELPWMDTPKSGFMTAFEGFWNNWGCHRENLMVVVCGSANSWILDNLINNHGGLYNRVTWQIHLQPFTLYECEQFFSEKRVILSRYDIAQSYMILGGIPYYMNYFRSGLSLSQNIDRLFFADGAPLRDEYHRLFSTVFSNPEIMKSIVESLSTKRIGLTRKELLEQLRIKDGAAVSNWLHALLASGFITNYVPFGESRRNSRFRLTDPFCLFYLRFIRNQQPDSEAFWQEYAGTQASTVWKGSAFENVCFQHIRQIKTALGITGVASRQSAWSKTGDGTEDGTQIDLLIERKDNIVNMCEIKFYSESFTVDKAYDQILRRRTNLLRQYLSPKAAIHSTLITTFGLSYNAYSGAFVKVITLDDLFSG